MAPRETAGATPMMAQYLGIKAEHSDALLFYRMGDFYELFFEDAEVAAGALDIALTKRGKHLGEDIAMCGVPVHSAESYLHTLIRKGHRVAVCEQTEDPAEAKKRGSKSVVRREVVRLVTPGTLTEDRLL
ncbi:MAG: DNA mismatch repair protein MutS, partial [Pseudomonadota bacterium]